jgi:myo-inositol-1(or 4)-monophosphatase
VGATLYRFSAIRWQAQTQKRCLPLPRGVMLIPGMRLPSRTELEELAIRAGDIALGHFRQVEAERKADRSLVTQADREVEAFLAAELGARMPDAGIIGEEGAAHAGVGPYSVVIDPIDGTSAFVTGLPTWCVCVGILRDGEMVAGATYMPCTRDLYSAADGSGWWNGRRLSPLGAAVGVRERFLVADSEIHLRHRLTYRGKVRSFGSAAYHVALVARGAAEAAMLGRPHVWDLAAPGAVLAAVGGRYEYLDGGVVDLAAMLDGSRAPRDVMAGTPQVLEILRANARSDRA